MTNFFRREAKFMLIWLLAVAVLPGVIAVIAGIFPASRH
jgi:hypothetical protein